MKKKLYLKHAKIFEKFVKLFKKSIKERDYEIFANFIRSYKIKSHFNTIENISFFVEYEDFCLRIMINKINTTPKMYLFGEISYIVNYNKIQFTMSIDDLKGVDLSDNVTFNMLCNYNANIKGYL